MKTSSRNLFVATLCTVLAFVNKAKCTGQILSTSDSPSGIPRESSAIPSESPVSPSFIPSTSLNDTIGTSQVEFTSHNEWLDAVGGQDSLICIDFNDYSLGSDITTQYANSLGVTFTNGRYQVSRFSRFMDGYGLFSFQGEIHIHLYAESSAIGVNLYQKYLRIRLLDDNGNQVYASSEFDGPQSFIGVLPHLAFTTVVLDCWNSCANEVAGCCRYFNMDRICFQSDFSAMPSVAPTTVTPSMSASPTTTTRSPSFVPSAAPSELLTLAPSTAPSATSSMSPTITPIASTGSSSIVAPKDSSSAQRTRVRTLLRLSMLCTLTLLYRDIRDRSFDFS